MTTAIETSRLGVRSKVWLEWEGHPVMGEGRMAMLQAIDRQGSIIQASHETGISYRRIRGMIRDMEATVGVALVRIQRGGKNGGGAVLTAAARQLMDCFESFSTGFQQEADARFRRYFK